MDGETPRRRTGATDLDLAWRDPEHLIAALLYLLVQLATRGAGVQQVLAIGHHFEMLAAHPDASESLRSTALQLRDQWLTCCAEAHAAIEAETGRLSH